MTELLMSRDLALKLGAISPDDTKHHRAMRDAGDLLIRDRSTGWALFWPWQLTRADVVSARSS